MTILINVVNDSKKHLFSNEKFYSSLNEQGNLVITLHFRIFFLKLSLKHLSINK